MQNECFLLRGRAQNYFSSFPVEMEGLPEGHREKISGTFCKAPWSKGKIFTRRHNKMGVTKTKLYILCHSKLEQNGTPGRQPESGRMVSKVTTKGVKDPKRCTKEHMGASHR